MFERFNNNFQNTLTPNTDFNPSQGQYFGQNDKTPYIQGMSLATPKPMPGNLTEQNLYPLESSLATPYLNTPVGTPYKQGGKVKGQKGNPYPSLAEMIRQQGRNGDTVLAHINPIEAQILKSLGGSGRINPKTGIPEFGGIMDFIANPAKMLKKTFRNPKSIARGAGDLLGVAGALFGGPVGAGLAGAARSAIRKENPLQGALKGGFYGSIAPMAANLAGQGLSALGANTLGSSLQNYATSNMGSWLGNTAQVGQGLRGLGLPFTGSGSGNSSLNLFDSGRSNLFNNPSTLTSMISGGGRGQTANGYSGLGVGAGSDGSTSEDLPFMDKLLNKSSDFFSEPSNLLTSAVLASSFMNRPKAETPEKRARDEKAYQKALLLTPEELKQKEAQELALAQMKRRIERNKFLPEERFVIEPLYPMKKGGQAKTNGFFEVEEMEYPSRIGRYIEGETKGQDDKIPAILSDGEFVIPADVVSDLGDGNNDAGAKELYKFMSNIRKHKRGGKVDLPPKAKSLSSYLRGTPKLTSSDKSLTTYMRKH